MYSYGEVAGWGSILGSGSSSCKALKEELGWCVFWNEEGHNRADTIIQLTASSFQHWRLRGRYQLSHHLLLPGLVINLC